MLGPHFPSIAWNLGLCLYSVHRTLLLLGQAEVHEIIGLSAEIRYGLPGRSTGDSEVPIHYEDLVRCICILSGYQPSVYSFVSLAKCLAMLNEPETYDCDPNPPVRVSAWDICWTLVTLVVYAPLSVLSSLCNPSTVLRWSAVKEQIGHNLLLWCVLAKQNSRGSIAY
jgi:hypothetical protein